jgi:hypothetical protein
VAPTLRECEHGAIAIERSGKTDKTDTKEWWSLVVGRVESPALSYSLQCIIIAN